MSYKHTSRDGTLATCRAASPSACPLKGRHYTEAEYEQLVERDDPRARPTPELDSEQGEELQGSSEYATARKDWVDLNKRLAKGDILNQVIRNEVEEELRTAGLTQSPLASKDWYLEQHEEIKASLIDAVVSETGEDKGRVSEIVDKFTGRAFYPREFIPNRLMVGDRDRLALRRNEVNQELPGNEKLVDAIYEEFKQNPQVNEMMKDLDSKSQADEKVSGAIFRISQSKESEVLSRYGASPEVLDGEWNHKKGLAAWETARSWSKWHAAGLPTDNVQRHNRLTGVNPYTIDASGPNGTFTNTYYAKGDEVSRVVSYTAPDESTRDGWDEMGHPVYKQGGFFTTETGERLYVSEKGDPVAKTRPHDTKIPVVETFRVPDAGFFVQEVDSPVPPKVDKFQVRWGRRPQ